MVSRWLIIVFVLSLENNRNSSRIVWFISWSLPADKVRKGASFFFLSCCHLVNYYKICKFLDEKLLATFGSTNDLWKCRWYYVHIFLDKGRGLRTYVDIIINKKKLKKIIQDKENKWRDTYSPLYGVPATKARNKNQKIFDSSEKYVGLKCDKHRTCEE